jgi:hypothetical protein
MTDETRTIIKQAEKEMERAIQAMETDLQVARPQR